MTRERLGKPLRPLRLFSGGGVLCSVKKGLSTNKSLNYLISGGNVQDKPVR